MNPELSNELKRKNLEDIKDEEIMDSKKRCSLLEISTSENTDPVSRALAIPEVLIRIVKSLPTDDIINCRGVNKLWNKYSEPKFVFRDPLFRDGEVATLLSNSGCRHMKVEFQNCNAYFLHILVDMWECGHKIRSLHLHYCNIEIDTLQSIISHCVVLEELAICKEYQVSDLEPNIWMVQLLDYFIERKERRTCLRALAIRVQGFEPTSEFLEKTFTVFPCIVDLGCKFDGISDDDEASRSASNRTYDLRKLESYTVVSENDWYLWSKNSVVPILDYQLLRLKKFKTVLHLKDFFTDLTKKERLFQFFLIQKDLEVIDLEMIRGYDQQGFELSTDEFEAFIKSFIFHILKSCSNLREFQLIGENGSIKLAGKEPEEFFTLISNLQSLKLSYEFKNDTSGKTVVPSSLPTFSLRVLRIQLSEPYFSPVIKLSAQLRHLYIDVNSDVQLREIILALPNLETLVLTLYGSVTNYGFIGENEEFSIRRLQNLKYLYITDSGENISKEIFDEFCFPRLKYLGLILQHREQLPETLSNMPALKTLKVFFREQNYYWSMLIDSCKSLTNLNHIIVRDVITPLLLNIFKSLSNLTFISCCEDDCVYIFNRDSEVTTCIDAYRLEFFENEFFGRIPR